MEEKRKQLNNVKCECGYQNLPENVKKYGACRGCGKILDKKAHYHHAMMCKLNMWRYDKKKRGFY